MEEPREAGTQQVRVHRGGKDDTVVEGPGDFGFAATSADTFDAAGEGSDLAHGPRDRSRVGRGGPGSVGEIRQERASNATRRGTFEHP